MKHTLQNAFPFFLLFNFPGSLYSMEHTSKTKLIFISQHTPAFYRDYDNAGAERRKHHVIRLNMWGAVFLTEAHCSLRGMNRITIHNVE